MNRITVFFLALVFTGASVFGAQEQVHSFTVSGEAVTLAVPDEAMLSLSVQSEVHRNKDRAASELDARATTLLRYLDSHGIAERKIESMYRRVIPVYDYRSGRRRRTGYQGSQSFQVVVTVEQVSEVIDDLPATTTENGIQFRVSNARQIRDDTVDAAIDDASARAQRRAAKLGITLGPVIGFNESDLGRAQAGAPAAAGRMILQDESAPQLPVGEDELRVRVSITYRIEVPE